MNAQSATLRDSRWWLVSTPLSVALLALVPLIWHSRFYFQDDTENGAYGVWYHLGEQLLAGKVPVLNPQVWSSGNYTAEGQWGTWNPLTMIIGIGVYLANDAVVVATIIKIAALAAAGLGCFLLARSFAVPAPFAFVAGVAVPLNGFTTFFDAPSWVTGELAWAIIPYFWLALRKASIGRLNPLWAFIPGYLIVTIGYVAGTVALGFVLLAVGIDALIRRSWISAARVAGLGFALVAVAVVVYLPGVLTAAVTTRSTTMIANDNYMSINLSGLLGSTMATSLPLMPSWWWSGLTAPAPAAYIAWFLPVAAFLSWRRIRSFAPGVRDIIIFGILSLMFVLLPTTIGPLRYPARFMPYVSLVCVLFCIVLLSHAVAKFPSRLSLVGATGTMAIGVYISWAQSPERYATSILCGCLGIAGIVAVWWILRSKRAAIWKSATVLIAAVLVLGMVGATLLQHRTTGGSPLSKAGVPANADIPKRVLAGVKGQVLVVGDPLDYPQDESTWSRTLMANTWYLSPAQVINRYQLVGFTDYNRALCLRYLGGTCSELLKNLFEKRVETGLTLADELQLDNVQILKKSFEGDQKPSAANNYVGRTGSVVIPRPPAGWHEASNDSDTALWSRDVPLLNSGGVTWQSEGTKVIQVEQTDTTVSLKVDQAPASGGRVALGRLPWPGYSASGASLSKPVDGFLLSIDIPAGSAGRVITVDFTPPGWAIGVAAWFAGIAAVLAWSAVFVFARARRKGAGRAAEFDGASSIELTSDRSETRTSTT